MRRYAFRVQQEQLTHLFARHCLDHYSDPASLQRCPDVAADLTHDYPMETNHLLQVRSQLFLHTLTLLTDLFFQIHHRHCWTIYSSTKSRIRYATLRSLLLNFSLI